MGFVRDGNTARALPYPAPEFTDKGTEVSPSPAPEQPHHTIRLQRPDWVIAALLTLPVGGDVTIAAHETGPTITLSD